jgi:hypothetical protein
VLHLLLDAAFEIVNGDPHHLTHTLRVHVEHLVLRLA